MLARTVTVIAEDNVIEHGEDRLYSRGVEYTFCTAPIKDNIYKITMLHTCKDYMHDIVRAHVNKGSGTNHGYSYGINRPVDMNNTRILLKESGIKNTPSEFKTGVFSGKRVINYYEKRYKMSSKTRLFRAINHEEPREYWMLIGPSEWVSNPYLLSLYLLIFRAFIENGKKFTFEDEMDIADYYKQIDTRDANILLNVADKIHVVLENRELLFKDLGINDLYPKDAYWYDFHATAGFHALCTNKSYNKKLRTRMNNLFKTK